jgi:hypothetical protein
VHAAAAGTIVGAIRYSGATEFAERSGARISHRIIEVVHRVQQVPGGHTGGRSKAFSALRCGLL